MYFLDGLDFLDFVDFMDGLDFLDFVDFVAFFGSSDFLGLLKFLGCWIHGLLDFHVLDLEDSNEDDFGVLD